MFDLEHHIYAAHEGPVTLKKDSGTFVLFEESVNREAGVARIVRGRIPRAANVNDGSSITPNS